MLKKKKRGATRITRKPTAVSQWKPMATPVSSEPTNWVSCAAMLFVIILSVGAEPLVNLLLS